MVVAPDDAYDESSIQVIDIKGIHYIAPNLYVLHTKPFNEASLLNGAGIPLTSTEKQQIIDTLSK